MYAVGSVTVGLFDLPFGVINCCFPQLHETDQTLQYSILQVNTIFFVELNME